jgi:hypothetical protein
MSDVGLLVLDEAHHASDNHPYSQLMEDFWAALPVSDRPHVLALTASPEVGGPVQAGRAACLRRASTASAGVQCCLRAGGVAGVGLLGWIAA